jgi:signal transduction histidine kinase
MGDAEPASFAARGYLGGERGKVERIQWQYLSIPADNLANVSAAGDVSSAAVGSSLPELCHDIIEPAATIRWLVRAASGEPGQDQQNKLRAIDIAAGQIAAICEHILDRPQRLNGVRLDLLAADAVASAQVRYAGAIDLVAQPVMALAGLGDIVRILCNILANVCRAAGPAGRIRVLVDQADGQARVAIADSGHGLGQAIPGSRTGLGLGLEIVGALALKCGGSVHLGVSELGGLAVTVALPGPGRSSN